MHGETLWKLGIKAAVVGVSRAALCVTAAAMLWPAGVGPARAQPPVENLLVPSVAMGRDIPVAFLGGGPHAVYLLDAFDAGDTVSNWVTAGNAMNALSGTGISVVAPAGGAYTMYTNWENDSSRQWDTFLTNELPDWLAANKGLASGGHAIVGAAQGGNAALILAAYRPDRFSYAGSMSGFLWPSNTFLNGAITDGMMRFGGVDTRNMWGLPQGGHWKDHDPYAHVNLFADNNTRVWVFDPRTTTASDPAAMIGYADQAQGTGRQFYNAYVATSARNGHFDFPDTGDHGWSSWGPELAKMSGDVGAHIR